MEVLLKLLRNPNASGKVVDVSGRIANYPYTDAEVERVVRESLHPVLAWAIRQQPPRARVLADPLVLPLLTAGHTCGDCVVARLLTDALRPCGQTPKTWLASEDVWRSCTRRLHFHTTPFRLALAFLAREGCTLSSPMFAALYWAMPPALQPLLLALLPALFPHGVAQAVHTVLFGVASFPPPVADIGAPVWAMRVVVGPAPETRVPCTVLEAYVGATLHHLDCWPPIPAAYIHPALDAFATIEPFWYELTAWLSHNPGQALSDVSLTRFARAMVVQNVPDLLFVLLDAVWAALPAESPPAPPKAKPDTVARATAGVM